MLLEISQNSQENTCARVSLLIKLQAQVFSCEFSEISKNTFFYRTPPVAASGKSCLKKFRQFTEKRICRSLFLKDWKDFRSKDFQIQTGTIYLEKIVEFRLNWPPLEACDINFWAKFNC